MSPESRAAGASHLRPTYEQTNAEQWQRPGGPWDVGPLGALSPSGDHLAVVDGSSRFEGRQFDALVDDLAARMRASGVGRGHVVAWQLPNSAASLLLYWACWRIGAVAAPLHRRLGAAEVSAALDQVLPAVVVATAGLPAADLPETLVLALAASPSDLAALFGIPGHAEGLDMRTRDLGPHGRPPRVPTSRPCCSHRDRAGSRRPCCTPIGASPTRRGSWPGCTGSARVTRCSLPLLSPMYPDCSTGF